MNDKEELEAILTKVEPIIHAIYSHLESLTMKEAGLVFTTIISSLMMEAPEPKRERMLCDLLTAVKQVLIKAKKEGI